MSGFSRTVLLCASFAWPSLAHAQAKDAFVDGLTQLINVVDGTYGDEGPALTAAVEAMSRGLAAWDARVAGVESGLRADIAGAAPPVAARMRATLGTVYLERGRIEDALAQFSAAVDLDPSLAQAHVLRGLAYERSNHPSDAASAYRAAWQAKPDEPTTAYLALRIEPANAAARTALWAAVMRRAESPGAAGEGFPVADLLDDASVALPLFARAAYGHAFALIRQSQYDMALARFRDAIASDPLVTDRALQSEEARRGAAALRARNVADATRGLEAAASSHPESSDIHRILGLAHAAAKQYEKSLSELRTASRLNPRDERSRLSLADVLVASGSLDAAAEILRETIREIPQSAEAHWQQGRLDQARADAGAVRAFERAATMPVVAGLGRLYAIVGQAHHAQFNVAAAEGAYRQRVRLTPNDRDAHLDLAEIYRAQDKLDDALVESLAAALLDPSHAKTFGLIGQVQAAAGRDNEALVALRHAVTLDGGLLDARYALSRALLRLGRSDEAAQELRAFEQAQAKAMDEQRRQFKDNQQKIDEVLKGR